MIDEVFNAVLIAAHNILMMSITPSPGERGRSNGRRPGPGPNLPTPSRRSDS